ncbi:unnamed protein product [Schistocephalus solidus]|uniref:Uncharacterized protein n=1 Tax=Schistocephalus solidus TaxID=70667 RepID=A0A3P7DPL4_SCHSO|nr:unnamed protein product [Schistocephalus solidus]
MNFQNDAAYNVAPDVEEGADRHEHQDCLQGDALPYGELSTELSYSLGRQQQHRQESSDTLEHSPTRISSPSEAAKGCEIKEHQNGTLIPLSDFLAKIDASVPDWPLQPASGACVGNIRITHTSSSPPVTSLSSSLLLPSPVPNKRQQNSDGKPPLTVCA